MKNKDDIFKNAWEKKLGDFDSKLESRPKRQKNDEDSSLR